MPLPTAVFALFALSACRPDADDPSLTPIEAYDPNAWVDPFIGTGGNGFEVGSVNPGPRRPFGMVHAGPDTRSDAGAIDFTHCAGYWYDDTEIVGFSQTHAHGMGVPDYGTVLLMPRAEWRDAYTRDTGRAAPFDHADEAASPGYYAVTLGDDGTRVEITTTDRAAFYRYTFRSDAPSPTVVVDLGHVLGSSSVDAASLTLDTEAATITGYQRMLGSYSGRYGGLETRFVAAFDVSPVAWGTWTDPDAPEAGGTAFDAVEGGAWVSFPPGTTTVTVRIGVSFVDEAGARGNLDAELPAGADFDAVAADAADAWRAELARVRVRGADDTAMRVFHTAMFHAMQMPTRFDDADGRYRGLDGEVHDPPGFAYYTDFSLWDTFRTLHPWLILANPDRQRDFNRSLVQHGLDGGTIDRWPLGHGFTGGMVGSPASQVLAEAWLKGLDDFDADVAFDLLWQQANEETSPVGRAGVTTWVDKGYVSWEASGSPAALTLEYAWNDRALAQWADALGRATEADTLWARSGNWANTWDAERGFFVGRYDDGSFTETFDETVWAEDYVEGNAWQYLWMVPYDVPGLIDVQHGGDTDAWLDRYAAFWDATYAAEDTVMPDPYYWHGNEPDLNYAWMGSLAGHPEASAAPVRWILANRYADAPDGLDGNDDGGTLSAWYLWTAIGLYPVAGTDLYGLGAPLFERVEIDHADGTLVIRAPGAGWDAATLTSARLGGEPIGGARLGHDRLVGGEDLVLSVAP